MKLETLYENKLFLLASSWKVSRGLSQTPSGWNRALESAQQWEAMCVSGGAAPRQSSRLVLVEVLGPPCLRTGSPEPDLLKDSSLLSCPLAAAGDQEAQVSRSSGRQGSWVSRRHKSGGAVEPRNPRVSRSHGPAGATGQRAPRASRSHPAAGGSRQRVRGWGGVGSGCETHGKRAAPDHEAADAAAAGTAGANRSRLNSRKRFVRARQWEPRKQRVGFRGGWVKPSALPPASAWAVGGSEARSGLRV